MRPETRKFASELLIEYGLELKDAGDGYFGIGRKDFDGYDTPRWATSDAALQWAFRNVSKLRSIAAGESIFKLEDGAVIACAFGR